MTLPADAIKDLLDRMKVIAQNPTIDALSDEIMAQVMTSSLPSFSLAGPRVRIEQINGRTVATPDMGYANAVAR